MMRQIRAETASGDRVVVRRKTLRFAESRDAPAAALGHVGKFWAAAVKSRNQRLCGYRHLMRRSITEVDDLLRMIQRVAGIAIVSRVAADRGVAAANAGCQRRDTHPGAASEAAVACSTQLAVPVCRREPDLDLDFGITRRPGGCSDAAERRQIVETRSSALTAAASRRCREGSRGNELRLRKGCVGDRNGAQAFTGSGVGCRDVRQDCNPQSETHTTK